MPRLDRHPPGSFCWIELGTTDQNAAKEFYTSLFGWTAVDSPMGPGQIYTIFKIGSGVAAGAYHLRPEELAKIPAHWSLYVAVENADDSAKRASWLGGTVLEGPFDVMALGRMAVIQDPTGAVFSLWQANQNPGSTVEKEPGTLCWADLSTPDPDRAKLFYEELFGWKLVVSEHDSSGYLHIRNGADFIGGIPPVALRNPHTPAHWLAYFSVADVNASTANATALGAMVHLAPMPVQEVGSLAILADPQGAAFAIFERS